MRRLGVLVTLGALLGIIVGAVTASPALARGPRWQFVPGQAPVFLAAAVIGGRGRRIKNHRRGPSR